MFRFAKNAAVAIALTGLALSQPALATRSAESLPAVGAKVSNVGRVGSPVRSSDQLVGIPVIAWLIAGLVIAGTIIIIADDNNNAKSPG